MTTNELGYCIDMIANKIGSTAQALQPITEEIIRQYRLESLVGCIVLESAAIVALPLGAMVYNPRLSSPRR